MTGLLMMAALGTGLVSTGLCLATRLLAMRVGFVDRPQGHKAHREPVALGGGVGIFWSVCGVLVAGTLAAAWWSRGTPPAWLPDVMAMHLAGVAESWRLMAGICAGALVLHVVGLVDDYRPLGPWWKLLVQVLVAAWVAGVLGVRAVEMLPMGASVGVTVLWIVAITNAFNFLDNMDGLSGGVGAIVAMVFGVTALQAEQLFVPMFAFVVAGALCGFLVLNFPPARLFMGDAGSLVVGYLLAVLSILTTYYDASKVDTPVGLAVPLIVLAIPLYDMLSVVIHRLAAGVSPFKGDHRHFSHRLVKRGMSKRGAVLTIYVATLATALPAVALPTASWGTAVLLMGQCVCVLLMVALLEYGGERGNDTSAS